MRTPERHARIRRPLLFGLGLIAVALAGLHIVYPLPYVYRVLVYQDSDFSDIYHFPSSTIAASTTPSELSVSSGDHAARVLEQHASIDRFGSFLEQTETTAFLVIHNGQLIEERYLPGHDDMSFQNTFSVSKSIMSALVGLAIRDGYFGLDDQITRFLPELAKRDKRFGAITIENLLNMQSGIRYSNDVKFPFVSGDDPKIYYHPDLESVVLEQTTIASPPGETFRYNNYNPPLIGLILRRATGMSVSEYLQKKLWQELGAEHAAGWTTDDHGIERMESGFHAVGRDLARFGLLFLNQGWLLGRQIIPQEWVLMSTAHADRMDFDEYDGRGWGYQSGWWIVPRAEGPPDFCAIGRYGQFIYVSPQYETVFVRFGVGRGDWGDRDWTELFYFAAARMASE